MSITSLTLHRTSKGMELISWVKHYQDSSCCCLASIIGSVFCRGPLRREPSISPAYIDDRTRLRWKMPRKMQMRWGPARWNDCCLWVCMCVRTGKACCSTRIQTMCLSRLGIHCTTRKKKKQQSWHAAPCKTWSYRPAELIWFINKIHI